MSDSKIVLDSQGQVSSYVGPDATQLASVIMLRSTLLIFRRGVKPFRGWTITGALQNAGRYTGQKYGRGEIDRAVRDLSVWIETMKSTLPVENQDGSRPQHLDGASGIHIKRGR